jgi:hypothetical protein
VSRRLAGECQVTLAYIDAQVYDSIMSVCHGIKHDDDPCCVVTHGFNCCTHLTVLVYHSHGHVTDTVTRTPWDFRFKFISMLNIRMSRTSTRVPRYLGVLRPF